MESIVPIKDLCKSAGQSFKRTFGCFPDLCTFAPGRVNLIGEHTDYHDGFVFPMALPLVTVVVGKKVDGDTCRIMTVCQGADEPKEVEFKTSEITSLHPALPKWANYVKGVIAMHPEKEKIPSFNALINSSVPCGSGLSSSAALEVSMFAFLDELLGVKRSDVESKRVRALKCQEAEHKFADVPCGIMDQLISSLATKDHALLIDCRSLNAQPIKLESDELAVLIINSNVKHDLSSGEYAVRKAECEAIKKRLNVTHLRDATLDELLRVQEAAESKSFRRARHVITENERCLQAFKCLKLMDHNKVGQLMCESHDSLRCDYEVSCPELDQLVDLAMTVEGVYGSRMTGGGFGGCTVTLLEKSCVDEVIKRVTEGYKGKPTFYLCTASAGAGTLTMENIMD